MIHMFMRKSILLILTIALLPFFLQGQMRNYLQGYSKEIDGKRFGYHSPIPSVNTSLLVRGQDDYKKIIWETEKVPEKSEGNYLQFIWLFGMDVVQDPVTFHLEVNNEKYIQFSSSKLSTTGQRVFMGENGSELLLNVTMLDKYKDQMGFAILKVPTSIANPGMPLQLAISAEPENNNAWFMIFKSQVHSSIDIYQNKVVAKESGNLYHSISIDIVHIGDPCEALINVGERKMKMELTAGFNKAEMNLPIAEDTLDLVAVVKIGEKDAQKIQFQLAPVKKWEVFLVQHTHTDIGYTRPQEEILPEHLRYIDMALDFCDQTDDYPDNSKFRWTCETSWSVREYLKSRPQEQIDRLLKRIQEGRIEATGMFLNFSEIADEGALAEQTRTLRMLKNKGIDVTTAMQNDVNGIAWCMVDYYHNTDVKYLNMGIHAHRARKPFQKPTSFWWESPAGNRLLAYRSEHYQHGNSLALTTGQQDVLRTNLSQYLTSLENRGYPYKKIALQFSGYITDNSPPSDEVCDIIRAWNEKYEWPKLRSALARDFLIWLDEQHHDDLQTNKVAWPDWWTDGVASAFHETKVVRNTQSKMTAITTLLSCSGLMGIPWPSGVVGEITDIYDNLLFYDEHTHGAAESVSDPLAQNTIRQWNMKSAYAWEATKKANLLEEKAMGFIQPSFADKQPVIIVFNSLNITRSGMVELFIQNTEIPPGIPYKILDKDNISQPSMVMSQRMEGAYYRIWVKDVPPVGFKKLYINIGEKTPLHKSTELIRENSYYKLEFSEQDGIITSIYDKELNMELLDQEDTLTLGQVIYERLPNRHDLERLTNNTRDTVYRPLNEVRTKLENINIVDEFNGAIYSSVTYNGKLTGCADDRGVDIEIRLYHLEKKISIHYRMFKLAVTDPESVYVSFPFKLDEGKFAFDVPGGIVIPGVNQLGGSSSDWNTVQGMASVRNTKNQILLSSPDVPLVQFGDINTGRYYYRLNPTTNHIFSWVLNNYWVTNFKASQEGEMRWSYSITSSNNNSDSYATNFGWSERVPFLTRVIMPEKGNDSSSTVGSLMNLNNENILLVSAYPALDKNGIILHLRETGGMHNHLDINKIISETRAKSAVEVNILEEEIKEISGSIHIDHYETKFIKLRFHD